MKHMHSVLRVGAALGCWFALVASAMAQMAGGEPRHDPGRASVSEPEIAMLDTNKDGRISRSEARHSAELSSHFTHMDQNGDGMLDAAEITGTGGGNLGEPEHAPAQRPSLKGNVSPPPPAP